MALRRLANYWAIYRAFLRWAMGEITKAATQIWGGARAILISQYRIVSVCVRQRAHDRFVTAAHDGGGPP